MTKPLNVKIDRTAKRATFWGEGTFDAKDVIKSLGPARWNGPEKSWTVSNFALSLVELESHFPHIVVVEEIGADAAAAVENGTPAPISAPAVSVPGVSQAVSVCELSQRIRSALAAAFPATVFVFGVISQLKRTRNGPIFIDLSDPEKPDHCINCVIWRDAERVCAELTKLGFQLEHNLQVMFEARVDLSVKSARVSLGVIRVVGEYTAMKVAALRELTNERLRKEGIFTRNMELKLGFLPRRLGVLTSAGGTVINDFMASLEAANFGFELYWLNVGVQGSAARAGLVQAIEAMGRREDLDCLLIFRGGGSAADLAVFSEYDVARAVCLCPLPVLSAIGHQEDQSSVQDVSFRAFGVPKDLGRFFADIVIERRRAAAQAARTVIEVAARLQQLFQQRTTDFSRSLYGLGMQVLYAGSENAQRLALALPQQSAALLSGARRDFIRASAPIGALGQQVISLAADRVAASWQAAEERGQTLQRSQLQRLAARTVAVASAAERIIDRQAHRLAKSGELARNANNTRRMAEQQVEALERMVAAAGPETQLKRGFAIVRDEKTGSYLTAAAMVKRGQRVEIEFADQPKKAIIE